ETFVLHRRTLTTLRSPRTPGWRWPFFRSLRARQNAFHPPWLPCDQTSPLMVGTVSAQCAPRFGNRASHQNFAKPQSCPARRASGWRGGIVSQRDRRWQRTIHLHTRQCLGPARPLATANGGSLQRPTLGGLVTRAGGLGGVRSQP